jgi:hypothetical protein
MHGWVDVVDRRRYGDHNHQVFICDHTLPFRADIFPNHLKNPSRNLDGSASREESPAALDMAILVNVGHGKQVPAQFTTNLHSINENHIVKLVHIPIHGDFGRGGQFEGHSALRGPKTLSQFHPALLKSISKR